MNYALPSTATEVQYSKIVSMLRSGEKSTFDFRAAGIAHPAARVKELNEKFGYSIPRIALRSLWDSDGFQHKGIAVYELQGEPGECADADS